MNKKGFSIIFVVVLAVIVIVCIVGYFVLSQNTQLSTQTPDNQTTSTSTSDITYPNGTSEGKSISSTLISFPHYDNGAFSIPATIQQGTEITLHWTSDKFLLDWGDKVYICLIALDAKKQMIEPKENKELCYPDMQLLLDTTTLSSGEYHWLATRHDNEFMVPPKSFKLSIRILDSLPSEGRSEWAGFISGATSNEFVIIP